MTISTATCADLAGRVLDLVRADVGPGAEAEVLLYRQDAALTRFANSYVHQNVAESTTAAALRLHVDGRTATATTNRTDGDGLRALVAAATTAAGLLPPDTMWAGLTASVALGHPGNVDAATAGAAPADRAERVRSFVDATEGLTAAGYCRTTYVTAAFANTAGQTVSGGYTEAGLDGVARAGTAASDSGDTADGVARLASSRLADIDGGALGARAAAKARAGLNPVYLPPDTYEVVLEPEAVGDLLGNLSMHGFNGKAFTERRSFVELGAAQFDPGLSIVDDPIRPDGFGLPFDHEGTPKRRLELVSGGVTGGVTHDRRTAREAGTASTGHAGPESGTFGPMAAHLAIEPVAGQRPPGGDIDELVRRVRRGLLVTDFWYTRVLDPRPLLVTGLTRNGLWLIEDGEVTSPVRNLRFTQPYPAALAPGRVLGMGSRAVTLPSGWGFTAYRARPLHLAAWRFTGGAQG